MNVQEMQDRIVEVVKETGGGTTFVEFMQRIGPEAVGELSLEGKPNQILWHGLSPLFTEAFRWAVRDSIDIKPTTAFVYLLDGQVMKLPIAKRDRAYKKPHWVPVVFNLKKKAANA